MKELQEKYRHFVKERDWETFHDPKNLTAALSVEASELLEIFMWLEKNHPLSNEQLQQVKDEMGDVFLYLIRLADVLNIDLLQAAKDKFEKVKIKYPIEKSKELGRALRRPTDN